MTRPSAAATAAKARALELLTAALAVCLTVVLGLAVPGLGLVLGVAAALIVYRRDRFKRNALIALGGAVTVVSVGLTLLAWTHGGARAPQLQPPLVVRTR